ncbi:MAG TPA: hypothetical protein PLA54_09220 [Spirochaetota bacterium]|nr:hypothetical protein [Spirochaetota bacterium]HQE59356.1 hypothetical protein [Spirochaetota bacterium]
MLTFVLGSFLLFSCSSDDSDDSPDYAKLADEKIWVFVSTSTLIKKCDINIDGLTADLIDVAGLVTFDAGDEMLLWDLNGDPSWQVFLTVAEPLDDDVSSSTETVYPGEMLFIQYNGSGNFSISTDYASNHLDIIKAYYVDEPDSSIKTDKNINLKQSGLLNFGISSK